MLCSWPLADKSNADISFDERGVVGIMVVVAGAEDVTFDAIVIYQVRHKKCIIEQLSND